MISTASARRLRRSESAATPSERGNDCGQSPRWVGIPLLVALVACLVLLPLALILRVSTRAKTIAFVVALGGPLVSVGLLLLTLPSCPS